MEFQRGRLAKATLVTAGLFLLLGGSLGFAAASGEDASEWSIAAPRPGDIAHYAANEVIVYPNLASPSGLRITDVRVEWLPERMVMDGEYGQRLAHPLAIMLETNGGEAPNGARYYREAYYDAFTGQPIYDGYWGAYETRAGNIQIGLDLLNPSSTIEYHVGHYDHQVGPCGFRVPFQGAALESSRFLGQGHCDWLHGEDTLMFKKAGEGRVQRFDTVRFESELEPQIALWYAESVSVPVRLRAALSEFMYAPWNQGRLWELELTAYERGDGAYTPVEAPVVEPGPGAPDPVARTPVTIDDSGLERPFHLQEAFDVALEEEGSGSFSAFLATHPDAYVGDAWTAEYQDEDGDVFRYWWIGLTDGTDFVGKQVRERPLGEPTLGVFAPSLAGRETDVSDWTPDRVEDETVRYPPPHKVPDYLPRVEDAMDRYVLMEGGDPPGDLNHWGFWTLCVNEGCTRVDTTVWAGHASAPFRGGPSTSTDALTNDAEGNYFRIGLAEDGTPRTAFKAIQEFEAPLGFIGDAAAPSEPTQAEGGDAAPWVAPAAPIVAGLGIFALLGGALYYFWPLLKTGPLALFSRISSDKILENPNRAMLYQIIQAEPGLHFQAILRRSGIGRGALEHHLRKLAEANLIVTQVSPGYTCYFPKGAVDRRAMAAAPALKSDGARRVMEAVKQTGGGTVRAVSETTGLSPSTVSHHMRRLAAAGLLEGGGRAGYKPVL